MQGFEVYCSDAVLALQLKSEEFAVRPNFERLCLTRDGEVQTAQEGAVFSFVIRRLADDFAESFDLVSLAIKQDYRDRSRAWISSRGAIGVQDEFQHA